MKDSKMRVFLIVAGIFLLIGLSVGLGISEKAGPEKDDFYQEVPLFTRAIAIIRAHYVDEVKTKDLIYGALKGMLSSLDPYSQFMEPEVYKEMEVDTKGEFGGLGIEIGIRDNVLTVVAPLDGTPADRVGIKAQDRIVKIDGDSTKDITVFNAVKKLRGEPGTSVTLTVLREKALKLLTFKITREVIKIRSVRNQKLFEDNIGYIKITNFQEHTPDDLESALLSLEKQGMDSLILDLRNNPGGLLQVSKLVSEKFLPDGKMIVYTKGRTPDQDMELKSGGSTAHREYPLIVLVNGGSASASEIVAGAIQDHGRGIILGTKTYGKGSVQTVFKQDDGSALRLTTSKYYTPSGRSIHEKGIEPDVKVEEEPEQEPPDDVQHEDVFEKIDNGEVKEELLQPEEPENEEPENEAPEEEKPEGEKSKDEKTEEKEVHDAQLIRAIDLMKGIKVFMASKQLKEAA